MAIWHQRGRKEIHHARGAFQRFARVRARKFPLMLGAPCRDGSGAPNRRASAPRNTAAKWHGLRGIRGHPWIPSEKCCFPLSRRSAAASQCHYSSARPVPGMRHHRARNNGKIRSSVPSSGANVSSFGVVRLPLNSSRFKARKWLIP